VQSTSNGITPGGPCADVTRAGRPGGVLGASGDRTRMVSDLVSRLREATETESLTS
jgi:hypothetical protein